MTFEFTDDAKLWEKRLACLERLKSARVDVGLTSSASGRSRFLLGIHEHGSPAMRIPARPVIAPALSSPKARAAMAEAMTEAVSAAMEGDEAGTAAGLEAAGQAGVDAIHAYIDAGVPPPNAPITVSGGWMWNRVAHKPFHVSGKGTNRPLYDTGSLYNDFEFEVMSKS